MELEFRLAKCTTVHFKCVIKSKVVVFFHIEKIKKQNACPCKFQKILKGLSFHCQKFLDQK